MGEFMGFFDKFNTQLKQTITKQEIEINELKNEISSYEQQLQTQNQILSDKENVHGKA